MFVSIIYLSFIKVNVFMIGKLTGKIDLIIADCVIINVGGVGYQVYCSTSTLIKLSKEGDNIVSLFIETHVREDRIHLFGFFDNSEKVAFNMLQNVSGIGPKMALQILSQLTPEQLQVAIDSGDKSILKSISGVGSKLVERIMVELKGKMISSININTVNDISVQPQISPIVKDAISALTALGVTKIEAANILNGIYNEFPTMSVNDLVKVALQKRIK